MNVRKTADPYAERRTEILANQHSDNEALIEYIAMMTDVELPTEEEESNDEE